MHLFIFIAVVFRNELNRSYFYSCILFEDHKFLFRVYIFGNCSTKELKYKCRKFSNMLCYICGRIKACDFRIWRDERTDAEVGCWRGAGGEEIEKGLVDSGVRVWECKGNTHVRV